MSLPCASKQRVPSVLVLLVALVALVEMSHFRAVVADDVAIAIDGIDAEATIGRRLLQSKKRRLAGGLGGDVAPSEPQLDQIPSQSPDQSPDQSRDGTLLDSIPLPSAATEDEEEAGLSRRLAASLRDVLPYSKLNSSAAVVRQFCEMVDHSLAPWVRIAQIRQGMGAGGMVAPSTLKLIGQKPRFMSCAGHVRVVDGSVFFRLGGFVTNAYRVTRFLQAIRTIQHAVSTFSLSSLRAEFFLNTCDLPISFDSDVGGGRPVGLPFFSARVVKGGVDVVVPDAWDLAENTEAGDKGEVSWEDKESRAVFRGSAGSFPFEDSQNWRAHPIIRLYRLSDARPDLLSVKLIGWGKEVAEGVRRRMEADGVSMFPRQSLAADPPLNKFKYQVVAGGASAHQTCAIMTEGQQLAIRQSSPYSEFFSPLLKPYVTFLPANRHFDNLVEKLRWAQGRDKQVQRMVEAAQRASKWACTRKGHTLYWAILLIKYSKNALQDADAIRGPVKTLCADALDPALLSMAGIGGGASSASLDLPADWPPSCSDAESTVQPKCVFYCRKGYIPAKKFVWVSAEALKAGGE